MRHGQVTEAGRGVSSERRKESKRESERERKKEYGAFFLFEDFPPPLILRECVKGRRHRHAFREEKRFMST